MTGPPRALIAVFGQAGAGGVQGRTASVAWAAELWLLRRDGRLSPGAGWGWELELWVLPWWPGRSTCCGVQADHSLTVSGRSPTEPESLENPLHGYLENQAWGSGRKHSENRFLILGMHY